MLKPTHSTDVRKYIIRAGTVGRVVRDSCNDSINACNTYNYYTKCPRTPVCINSSRPDDRTLIDDRLRSNINHCTYAPRSLRRIVITNPRRPSVVMHSNFERFVVSRMIDATSNETAILCVYTWHADLVPLDTKIVKSKKHN